MSKWDEFSGRLREAMEAKRCSQSSLARKSGVTPTAVWNWLEGNTIPRPHTLQLVAQGLETTPEYLLNGGDVSTPDPQPRRALDEIMNEAQAQIAVAIGLPPERIKVRFEVVSD
jgi:transcriptional regulator with XRE-family HTH domain